MDGLIIPASVARAKTDARSCLECRYHGREDKDVVCRRYPPQVTVLMVPLPAPRVGQAQPVPFATFPPVQPNAPCGEWAARIDA